jgi:hypothetical protein
MVARSGRGRLGGPSRLPSERAERVRSLKSTIGRPRVLTLLQVRRVLAAHARFLAWRALRRTVKSQRQLAEQFGVSPATISLVIRSHGRYKQPPPERRVAELLRRHRLLARLRGQEQL